VGTGPQDERTTAQQVTFVATRAGGKVRAYAQLAAFVGGVVAAVAKDDPTLGFALMTMSGAGLGLQGIGKWKGRNG